MNAKISLKNINPFRNIGGQEFIAIDVSSSAVKIAHLKVSAAGKKEVANLITLQTQGLAEAEAAKAIASALAALKIKTTKIIDVIPSHLVITKNIELPTVNPQEIREIVNLQAGRHTPYSREEIIVDYINIGTYKRNYSKVLLVIVSRSAVKKHSELLAAAGLKMHKALFAPEGIARFTAKSLRLENFDSTLGLLYIGDSATDFSIVLKGKVVFVRSIPIGTQHLTREKAKYQTKYIEELKKSLEAYQGENVEGNPQQLILLGAAEGQADLVAMLNEAFHLPVREASYLKNIVFSETASRAVLGQEGHSFLGVIAPAIFQEEASVDLVPEEIKARRNLEERAKVLFKTGLLALATCVALFSIFMSKIYFESAYLKKIEARLQGLDPEAKKVERDLSKNNLIRNYLLNRGYSLEVLTELYQVTPLEIGLDDIRFDAQGKFSVKGTAESMSAVFTFVDSLEKSKYFREVKTKYTTKRKEGKKDVTDFEINCLLERGRS